MREIFNVGNIPVIFERVTSLPGLFTISVFFDTGSSNETKANNGVSHFIEHMAFRGTRDYSSEEISRLSEMYGGYMNAYTSKETTAYYIKGFSGNLELFIKLMANICFYPVFEKEDFEQEKQIIIDEINSIMDNPEEYLGEVAEEELFKGCSLELPVSGTVESVSALEFDELKRFYTENYISDNCVIAVCGDVGREDVLNCVSKYFPSAKDNYAGKFNHCIPAYSVVNRDFSFKSGQSYVQLMYPAFEYGSEERYPLSGGIMLLGGLMSSRLFQEIREKRGLCYNIEAESVLYKCAGYANILYSCAEKSGDKVLELVLSEIRKLVEKGISDDELTTVKNQLIFSYISNFETLESRVQMNFRHIYHYGRLLESDEIMSRIESLDRKSIQETAQKIFGGEYSICRLVK
ncbi:M16 family metallopeptidase [Seleniivibrio woodruffii]|uniref:M16 family metallopeptidase n=1 Tax=Seleniivibrio woodruffii TaxID=1078050 RepID=UPI0039E5FD62